MSIEGLNEDVLHHILHTFELDDVLSLESVNRKTRNAIRSSKSIWIHLLRQCILDYDLKLPFSDGEAINLSATQVKSCLRSAFLVGRNLRKGIPISTVDLPPQLPITWVRIIRSRWVLVAGSDDNHSMLSCWVPIPEGGEPGELSQHYLEGPVVDGEVNDGLHCIVIAVTVETWPPKICILSLQNENGVVFFSLIREIARGSHVAALRDDWLAFRVYDGAEEAQLAHWTTGRRSHLDSTNFVGASSIHRPEYRGPALSIALWQGYAIVIFRWEVHVFAISDSPILLQSTELPVAAIRSTGAAMFTSERNNGPLMEGLASRVHKDNPTLFLFTRDVLTDSDTAISVTAMTLSTNKISPLPLVLTSLGSIKDSLISHLSHEMSLSSTGSSITWVHGDLIEQPELVILHLQIKDDQDFTQKHPRPLATVHTTRVDDLPLLVPRISMALDDAGGLLVVGTILGELTIAKFYDSNAWEGLQSSLPLSKVTFDMQDAHSDELSLSKWPQLRRDEHGDPITGSEVREIYTSAWGVLNGTVLPEEWTTDWDSFKEAPEWFPLSRRQAHCTDVFAGVVANRLCEEYGVIGTPVLLCRGGRTEGIYRTSVLFKIGKRPYFTRSIDFLIPFAADGHALSIEEILLDPTAAYRQSVDAKENMTPTDLGLVDPLWYQRLRSAALEEASKYVSRNPEMALARSADPSSWSAEEWENLEEGLPSSRLWKI